MTAAVTTARWRVLAASVIGSGHVERDQPCQDDHAVAITDDGVLVIAVADGAGSAQRSDEGARCAVNAAVAYVLTSVAMGADRDTSGDLEDDADADDLTLCELLREAVSCARDTLVEAAGEDDPRKLATTLALLVVDGEEAAAAQVGDGAVVLRRAAGFEVLGPVDREEFLNETTFLTSSDWEDELRVDTFPADDLDDVAVMTDGLQLLALDMADGTAHDGFFRPIFEWVSGPEATDDELASFLASDRVCARTDDDKTLVVAVPAPDSR